MRRTVNVILIGLVCLVIFRVAAQIPGSGATIAEVAAKVKSLKTQERINYLFKGAQAEGELVTTELCRSMSFCRSRGFLIRAIVRWRCIITFRRATAFSVAP